MTLKDSERKRNRFTLKENLALCVGVSLDLSKTKEIYSVSLYSSKFLQNFLYICSTEFYGTALNHHITTLICLKKSRSYRF